MSFQVPQSYVELPSVAIPATLVGDQLKQFNGMRTVIKTLPSASGSNIGPSSSILFNIPAEPYGYIKSRSMYLRATISLTAPFGSENFFAFAGNTYGVTPASGGSAHGAGGASSIITRTTVTLPGGASMSYGQQNHWRNAVVPHILNKPYIEQELKELEFAGQTRQFSTGGTSAVGSPTVSMFYVVIPMDIPVFNGSAAFPLLLMSGGIQIEMVTAALGEAFTIATTGTANNISVPTAYSLSGMSLVYEVMQVTPDFKAALVSSKASNPYMIHVSDRTSVGPVGLTGSTRYNFGVGLSSVKGVLFTEQLSSATSAIGSLKGYTPNAMDSYCVYRDGQLMSIPNITSRDVAYAELNRTLGRMFDPSIVSANQQYTGAINTVQPSSYTGSQSGSFLAGCSFENIDDWSFSAQGSPCDQIAIELVKSSTAGGTASTTVTAYQEKWGYPFALANANLYLWVLHDSVVVVLPDGTCQVRK